MPRVIGGWLGKHKLPGSFWPVDPGTCWQVSVEQRVSTGGLSEGQHHGANHTRDTECFGRGEPHGRSSVSNYGRDDLTRVGTALGDMELDTLQARGNRDRTGKFIPSHLAEVVMTFQTSLP